jgi:hypothetical protein
VDFSCLFFKQKPLFSIRSNHLLLSFITFKSHHLPENHPDKPKDDWFSSTIARVTASVATELATSMGYELSFFVSFF